MEVINFRKYVFTELVKLFEDTTEEYCRNEEIFGVGRNLIYTTLMNEIHRSSKRRIFAHRGLWNSESEQNSIKAISEAIQHGFAVETDLRCYSNEVIVSHDSPTEEVVRLFELENWKDGRFALNIKEDGLHEHFVPWRSVLEDSGSFLFDGSTPDMLKYAQSHIPIANRLSEVEELLKIATKYVWLDAFQSEWWDLGTIQKLCDLGYEVIIVSPELHGRNPSEVWDMFAKLCKSGKNVGICTDFPIKVLDRVQNV